MYRSASWNRVSDEYFMASSKSAQALRSSTSLDGSELPMYDPIVEMTKRERAHAKLAENAVHLIPLVLLICAFVLWFFSNSEIDIGMKGERARARIEGLTIEGEIDNDSDGTQTGVLPLLDLRDTDSERGLQNHKASKKF